MSFYIIFLGAPGSGKGTQATEVSHYYSVDKISTGDLVRSEIRNQTPVGINVKKYIETGQLVPDNIITQIFRKHLNSIPLNNGFVLDGFPRTINQAIALDLFFKEHKINTIHVINLGISLDEIMSRILARKICVSCNSIFNERFNPSKVPNKCDHCGGHLAQRSDDKESIVRDRFNLYTEMIRPVLEYYGQRIHNINAKQPSNDIFELIKKIVGVTTE